MPSATANQHSPLLLATDASQTPVFETLAAEFNPLRHSPYGTRQGERAAQGHLGFNGQLREQPSGWYHLGHGHRIYNPVLRRFHSPDALSPFGAGGLNPYAYCQGDPVNFTDPSGREVEGTQILSFVLHGLLLAMGGALLATPHLLQRAKTGTLLARYRDKNPQLATPLGGLDRVGTIAGMAGSVAAIGANAAGDSRSGVDQLYSALGIAVGVVMLKSAVLVTPTKNFTSMRQEKFATFIHGRKAIKDARLTDSSASASASPPPSPTGVRLWETPEPGWIELQQRRQTPLPLTGQRGAARKIAQWRRQGQGRRERVTPL
ncbi:RHS repeat-associated core domain-containing protein [Pseudomonas japonica]|uniref:RHS repeat-associated core domain-containing protein n=1 Tax=Pseudomonas japonica TaxID=256466 RepID=UPI0038060F54